MSKLLKWKNIFKASLNRQILSTRNYIIISKERMNYMEVKRGDLFYADLSVGVGREQ